MDVRSASHPILNNTGAFREIRLSRFCRKGDGSWVMERGLGDGCNNTLSKRPPPKGFSYAFLPRRALNLPSAAPKIE